MSDVVDRLLLEAKWARGEDGGIPPEVKLTVEEAAEEILRLRAEGKDLREHIDAIKWSADYHKSQNCMEIQNVIIKQRDEAWEEVRRLRLRVRELDEECQRSMAEIAAERCRADLAEQEKK